MLTWILIFAWLVKNRVLAFLFKVSNTRIWQVFTSGKMGEKEQLPPCKILNEKWNMLKMSIFWASLHFYPQDFDLLVFSRWAGGNFKCLIFKWMQLSQDYTVYHVRHSCILIFCLQPSSTPHTSSVKTNGEYYSSGLSPFNIKYVVSWKHLQMTVCQTV